MSVVRALSLSVVLLIGLALLVEQNPVAATLGFYLPVFAGFVACAALIHRGRVALVGWLVALLVWATVTVALIVFGGLTANNAMPFTLALTIAVTVAGARAGLVVGLLSVLSSLAVLGLQTGNLLPEPVVPPSAVNGFLAVLLSLGLSAWLLSLSQNGLRRALEAERRASAERDLAHARALQGQRLETVGRLAAGVAHDLNNLLGVVRLASDALRAEVRNRPELAALADELSLAADEASLLSRRLVAMSRTGGSPAESLEAGEVVEQFAPLLRRLLPPSTELRIDRRARLPLQASRSALEHVLLNLVLNARDAMPKGGAIDVVVEEGELQVRDQGVGITPEVKERLFEPFFTTRENGTGLGLSNVAELAAAMKAEVKVDSVPGQGSTFHVVFREPPRP